MAPVERHRHAAAHITDSRFHGHAYATDATRRIFCDVCRLQRWLDVEAALAVSQADVGMLPPEVAAAIADASRVELLDLDAIAAETRRTHHSLIALIRALQDACAGAAGESVHYGATTQDIQDTAQSLEMRDVLDLVDRLVEQLLRLLLPLARAHAETVMTGRTHAQPALPLTFGLKVGSWIDELLRMRERLAETRARVLVAQLFGGVGSMAAFGDDGPTLLARFAARLGLGVPLACWHASRDRVSEYVGLLALLAATAARIADEIRTLARPELGELTLGWCHGLVGSSTMPHKRNPERCEQIVVLARLTAAQVPIALQAMVVEHERDSRELRTEWAAVPDASHYAVAALAILRDVLAQVTVDTDAMARNAAHAAGELGTERLMLSLGRRVGKQSAYTRIYDAAQAAREHGRPLREQLLHDEAGAAFGLTAAEIDAAFDPRGSIGIAPRLVEAIVRHGELQLALGRPAADRRSA
jgi:adenylosuccinate lyase